MSRLQLEQLQSLYAVMAEEAIMGFVTFDVVSRECVYMNKRAQELFETNNEDFKINLESIFGTESRGDFKAFNEDLIAHEGFYQDILMRRPNAGQSFIANVGVKRVTVAGKLVVVLMIQDVTLQKKLQREVVAKQIEIKSAYEELIKQNRQLKELDLAKNRFIALTTHELRTPLSAMVAAAEILHLRLYDSPEQMKEFIDMIYDQGQHLHALVNDILDFAKIQAGRMDFFIAQQDPMPLLKTLTESFTSMADAQKISIQVKPCNGSPICYFDDLRLKQVLSNIINNAIKYNRNGGTVTVWADVLSDKVKISVRDTGNGIAPEQIEKVFNEFETLGQVAAHHKGTGLGMPISRRLMEGMGGKLLVESEIGVGSTFWIEIPTQKILGDEVYHQRPSGLGDLAA